MAVWSEPTHSIIEEPPTPATCYQIALYIPSGVPHIDPLAMGRPPPCGISPIETTPGAVLDVLVKVWKFGVEVPVTGSCTGPTSRTVAAGVAVQFLVDGSPVASGVTDYNGAWRFSWTAPSAPGTYTIHVLLPDVSTSPADIACCETIYETCTY